MIRGTVSRTRAKEKCVLIVEDDIANRYLLSQALRIAGYIVHEAVNGLEALRLLLSPIRFNAVISDVQMPGDIDGISLAQTIRGAYPGVNVALMSGLDLTERLSRDGVVFFRKPYNLKEILEHLKGA